MTVYKVAVKLFTPRVPYPTPKERLVRENPGVLDNIDWSSDTIIDDLSLLPLKNKDGAEIAITEVQMGSLIILKYLYNDINYNENLHEKTLFLEAPEMGRVERREAENAQKKEVEDLGMSFYHEVEQNIPERLRHLLPKPRCFVEFQETVTVRYTQKRERKIDGCGFGSTITPVLELNIPMKDYIKNPKRYMVPCEEVYGKMFDFHKEIDFKVV